MLGVAVTRKCFRACVEDLARKVLREPELPTHCQPPDQEEIRKATTNQDHSGSRTVADPHKQSEPGQGRKSQDAVFVT